MHRFLNRLFELKRRTELGRLTQQEGIALSCHVV